MIKNEANTSEQLLNKVGKEAGSLITSRRVGNAVQKTLEKQLRMMCKAETAIINNSLR